MTDYPLTRALIVEVCELEPGDEQLPIEILINVHRGQLRRPFEGLVELAASQGRPSLPDPTDDPDYNSVMQNAAMQEPLSHMQRELRTRYPILDGGSCFGDRSDIMTLETIRYNSGPSASSEAPESVRQDPLAVAVLELQQAEWQTYDPIGVLHRLTWAANPKQALGTLNLLEAELDVDPEVYRMVVDMSHV